MEHIVTPGAALVEERLHRSTVCRSEEGTHVLLLCSLLLRPHQTGIAPRTQNEVLPVEAEAPYRPFHAGSGGEGHLHAPAHARLPNRGERVHVRGVLRAYDEQPLSPHDADARSAASPSRYSAISS